MASMPRGRPTSVPDPAGDLYDEEMAKMRAQQEAEDQGFRSPLDVAQDVLLDFQNGPKIQRPSVAESFIPIVGPAWEAAADLQEGDYGGAVFNGAMAVTDALPIGVAVRGARAASKGIGILKKGSVSANVAAKQLRSRGLVKRGEEEVHHTVPLKGKSRTAQDPRNHYALLKVMPKETHRRLTGSWNGKPRFDPLRRIWHGTNDWQKIFPTSAIGYLTDSVENITGTSDRPSTRSRYQ
jgi:hypothetical protein